MASNVTRRFSFSGFQGFSGTFNRQLIKEILSNPSVIRITRDREVLASEIQYNAPRHLARIGQRYALPLPTTEVNITTRPTFLEYCYDESLDMTQVDAYILDSGIYKDHPELEGRAHFGADFTNEGHGDINGHGTHVAGLIGSRTYGSAKGINLIEVKVLNHLGVGLISWVISGLEFAVQDHQRKIDGMDEYENNENNKAAVINISLGTPFNQILNDAVNAAVRNGLAVVVAAGNERSDACTKSPASADLAITVGALDDTTDQIAGFSNFGKCVNILAPGVKVASLSKLDQVMVMMSGTSMASPIVAGILGTFLAQGDSVEYASERLMKSASLHSKVPNILRIFKSPTPNKVVYNDASPCKECSRGICV